MGYNLKKSQIYVIKSPNFVDNSEINVKIFHLKHANISHKIDR